MRNKFIKGLVAGLSAFTLVLNPCQVMALEENPAEMMVEENEVMATLSFEIEPSLSDNGDSNLPKPGHTFEALYKVAGISASEDVSEIAWYRTKGSEEVLIKSGIATTAGIKSYKLAAEDTGYVIKLVITPKSTNGDAGEAKFVCSAEVLGGYEDPEEDKPEIEIGKGINVYLAGDSTVCTYTEARAEGAWGEYIQNYFNKENVNFVNKAKGGRSTRNFINEGSLDSIKQTIKAGDYLFIQFGHNDCADDKTNKPDRYVPLGEKDENGIYPVTPGVKTSTEDSGLTEKLISTYGDEFYAWDCGGTYKWFLLQYINVAREANAIPVLVTPVSRAQFSSDGKIKPHHCISSDNKDNNYVIAVRQLAEEENVLLIDGFELTKTLMEKLYADAVAEGKTGMYYVQQGMFLKSGEYANGTYDKTHCNKIGGMVEAAIMTKAIQDLKLDISYATKLPAGAKGTVTALSLDEFTVDDNGVMTCGDTYTTFVDKSDYWSALGTSYIAETTAARNELAKEGYKGLNNITLTFDPVDGSLSDQEKILNIKPGTEDVTLPIPAKDGYEFAGWYTGKTTGVLVDKEYVSNVREDRTFYARYTKTYKVTFDANGGTVSADPMVIAPGKAYGALPVPARDGYEFVGWYTDKSAGTKVTEETIFDKDKDTILYAHWNKIITVAPYITEASEIKGASTDTLVLGKGTDKKGNNITKLTAKLEAGTATVMKGSKITITDLAEDPGAEIIEGADLMKIKYTAAKGCLTIQAKKPGKAVVKYANNKVQTFIIVAPAIAKDKKSQSISEGETASIAINGVNIDDKEYVIDSYQWTVKGGKSQTVDQKTGETVVLDKNGDEIARVKTFGATATVKVGKGKGAVKLTAQYLNKKVTATVKVK